MSAQAALRLASLPAPKVQCVLHMPQVELALCIAEGTAHFQNMSKTWHV